MEKIKEIIKLVLKRTLFKFGIENVGYLPRWIVLFWDVQIVFFSLITSGFITNDFSFIFFNRYFLIPLLVGLIITTGCFFLFKTYVGLIRHSSYIDAVKLLLASVSSAGMLIVINFLYYKFFDEFLYSSIFLILFFLCLFVGLFFYRVVAKQIYSRFLLQDTSDVEKVFILGVSQNTISLAVAIENEYPRRFKVMGFLEKEKSNSNKRVLGLPIIYLKRKIYVIIRAYQGTGLIVLEDDLRDHEKIQMIDNCIEHNIKIYRSPSISEMDSNSGINESIQNIQIEDLLEREPIEINNNEILNLIENKTVFVTGGAGSIGSEIVNQLSQYKPKKLVILDQAETPLHSLTLKIEEKYNDLNFHPIICDVRNKENLEHLFNIHKPEIIYHCAAYKHVPLMEKNPSEAVSVNILGTKNLADLAAKYSAERFIMISTDKAVNPSNVMGASKRVAEIYVQSLYNHLSNNKENKTKFITTRFGNVLGSNGSVVPLFKKQIQQGGPVTITHPDIIRYFMTIPEACQLVMEASSMGEGGEIFIFDMGKAVKIIDLANKMIRLAGHTPNRDIKIKAIGLRPGEKLYEELLNDKSITLPTYHKKIMIVKANNDEYLSVNTSVQNIIEESRRLKETEIVKKIKELVPEYKSLNSYYEKLDK
ncbi:SDR family NAD(P)-dependent oxidoreductase [Flavobacteriaceae bacterium AU392]|nr:polysaccharide biosynthesis protein [Flavobacteriaceae bacterium]RKM84878.1 SDR family NAD(P)-dependent oxidoreductase [Flavobacteriaceae bacterium AU392]